MSGTTRQPARHVKDLWTGRQTPRVRELTSNQLGKASWTLICALAAQGDYSWYGLSTASHIAMTWFCLSLHDKDIWSEIKSTNARRKFTNLLSIPLLANDAISVTVWAVVNQDSSLSFFLLHPPLNQLDVCHGGFCRGVLHGSTLRQGAGVSFTWVPPFSPLIPCVSSLCLPFSLALSCARCNWSVWSGIWWVTTEPHCEGMPLQLVKAKGWSGGLRKLKVFASEN